jgi:hypothetical protein
VDGLASPYTGLWRVAAYKGTGLACEARLVAVVVSDICRRKGSFSGRCYWLEVLSSSVPAHGISYSKMGSY